MMSTNAEFLDEVKRYILDHHAFLHHPFVHRVLRGEARQEELQGFAREFWVIPKTHLINNAGKLAHAHLARGGLLQQMLDSPYDAAIVTLLGESVADEMGKTAISPENHYDCYFNLTDALDIPRPEVGRVDRLLPQTVQTMYTWVTTALYFSLLELLASHNLCNDPVNVVAYPPFCEALQTHYGLSREAVRWFALHGEVDKEHNARSTQVLETLIRTEEDRTTVWAAVKLGLAVRWTLFDGIWHAYVDRSYRQ